MSQPYLSPQSQEDEHEEEEQRPERWDGKQSEGFWVGHEGQPWAVVSDLRHGDVQVVRHEAQDGENDEAGVYAGCAVGYTDDDAVSVCIGEKKKDFMMVETGTLCRVQDQSKRGSKRKCCR